MKILWVNFGGVLPLDMGGRIRSFHIVRELAKRHEVTLFTFYPRVMPDPHDCLNHPFKRVELLPLDLPEVASFADVLAYAANALTMRPYQITRHCPPQVSSRLRELLYDGGYDVVVCDFLLTASVMHWESRVPTVIFAHNVDRIIWRRRFLVDKRLLWRLVAWREWRTMARAEQRYTQLANHVLTVSEDDRRAFAEYVSNEKLTAVPTGVDLEYFRPVQAAHLCDTLIFTGTMDWMPNEDAILYFYFSILPLIRERVPDVRLRVVGRKPSRKILALKERDARLEVTGVVDDIRPYVSSATVYVVPLRIGGGTRIKIFEAMAMGMAIVSTTIGAEGLPVEHGKNILLADTPVAFADATVMLLTQPVARQRIGSSARTLVEERYDWTVVTDVVDQALRHVVEASVNSQERESRVAKGRSAVNRDLV
jgi:glycosyltransferase involved in cell wall biosynthesis